jgi:hypothetical protein
MNAFLRGALFTFLVLLPSLHDGLPRPSFAAAEEINIVVPPEVQIGCIPPIKPNCPPPELEPCLPPMYPPHPPHYPLCEECHWMWPNPTGWCRRVFGHGAEHPPFAPWVENPCGTVDCDFVRPRPPLERRYVTAADAVFLFRDDPDLTAFGATFAADFTSVNGIDMGVAPRLQIIGPVDNVWDIEGNYFGVDSWHVAADYDLPGGDTGTLDFNSQIHSSELNFRHNTRDWLKLLWGFRYVEFAEDLDFTAPSVGLPALWHFDTRNFFYGGQIGADVGMLRLFNRLEIAGVIKAGIYDNRVISRQEVITVNLFSADDTFLDKFDRAAFIGEGALGATLRFNDHSALRGGYQMMWLEDVSTAINSFTEPRSHQGLLLHGAYAGLELRW